MNIKLELLRGYISDYVKYHVQDFEIDANSIVNTIAINALDEIRYVITDDKNTDFEVVEKIVNIFEKYDLDFGSRHDF